MLEITRLDDDAATVLRVVGLLGGSEVATLQAAIVEAVVGDHSDELVVDLAGVDRLGVCGHHVLVTGYIVAVEYGAAFRVINARGPVLCELRANHTFDMLADSRDLGALLLAVVRQPAQVWG
ncbi:STAS domain-containing protein [Actinoplanes sichuanensis]|uniref:STAS domain-containing protein n=1 Tax=Actinoplanes sichuanensis TaxID=512349 RepID=A0ABW4A1Y4_9ACTN